MAVPQKAVERQLAAIMMTDIVGYSHLMVLDDVATLEAMDDLRRSVIDPAVARHHGRIIKTIGDGLMVEFASVVDAVTCALTIQQGSMSRSMAHSDPPLLLLRVGINLGDGVVQDGDLFGEGVNVAARLKRLSEPGGICLTQDWGRRSSANRPCSKHAPGSRALLPVCGSQAKMKAPFSPDRASLSASVPPRVGSHLAIGSAL
jgi:class 3 adenylate cyclase